MATSTVARATNMAYLILGLTSVLSVVSADKATTSTLNDLPDNLNQFAMELSIGPVSGPVEVGYKVAPLTGPAGLNQTNPTALDAIKVQGNIVVVDQTNYNQQNVKDSIAYLTCDSSAADNTYLSPNDVLNSVMTRQPKAILLYSIDGTCCSLEGTDLSFNSIWTMTNSEEASATKNMTSDPSTVMSGTIQGSGNDADDNSDGGQSQGGNNSAVAMSILYSITGLITLLFLIIIATGAIRAHRHPERYGPRASYGGRPRQSRAKGLARAVLETLPIIKFGDPQPAKPDPENELESIAGDRQQHSASPAQREVTATDVEQAGSSPDAAARATNATSEVAAAAASGDAKVNGGQTEEDHLGCSICTEDFSVGQDVRVLPCDHKFHPQCIDPWLVNVSGTCPLCRLDLRPQEGEQNETDEGTDSTTPHDAGGDNTIDNHLVPPSEGAGDGNQGRRISRLLDWNRLRHASVDERIQALRQYRQSQGTSSGNASTEDQNHHTKLSDRLREKFHIRTRAHPPNDSPSTSN
ncbi:uncharacterized protein F4822DRAFT_256916 [Hypoxylon trugodes]|uniref:uncharacterized protein n=1 Tax=Hypoxylon trugodes TaxID=326681 RepID=UPI0021926761|nr:uncharacterized protein F4822DRAFT_256916 [Hypoxylon trugodes]KAI1388767.1 hypothetical protein F4822DRAFT_256916 [Hypoxylon trugodes]